MHLRTIYPILLLLAGSVAILPAATVAPEKEPVRPLQPVLIELLDQERGNWIFMDANGQAMRNDGNIRLTGKRPEGRVKEVRIMLDDPEFPGDDAHAKKISFPINDNKALLDTGNFKAAIALEETKEGIVAELNQIRLGSAMAAKGIPAMITLWDGERETALALEGKTPGLKLATDRVGGVFEASEEPVLFVERPDNAAPVGASILVRDYFRDKELSRIFTKLNGGRTRIKLPIDKFGTFVVSVDLGGTSASRRITRIPDARMVEPDRSFVGMNIFQHSIPYLTYQLPLFAKAGVRHLRPWLHWENTWANQEPRKGEFNTVPLDMLLRRMALYNQNYEYTLYKFSPVIGLKSASALEFSSLDDEQMKEWQAYVRRIVTHCKGKVNEWEVWNEPDLLNSSKNAGFSGEFYAKFLIATAKAIREADPDAKIHALSHAFLLDWLREVGKTDVRPYLDALTLHSYAGPAKFVSGSEDRQQVIYDMGLWNVPQYYNEIANAGFDLSEAYRKALPNNSERNQAIALPLNYLQSLHLGGPKGRAYWFCSLGPRDGFHDLKWDSTNGLLYVGEQPKAAFPALAAMAWLCDGYTYLGRVQFENGVRFMPGGKFFREEGAAAFVEDDGVVSPPGPVGVDQDFTRGASPDLVRNPALPVDFGQNAFGVAPIERTGVHEGMPHLAHSTRIVTLAEEPEQPARIAVEDRVVHPDVPPFDAVGEGVALDHGAVADDEFGFAAVEVDQPEAVGVGIGGVEIIRQHRVGVAVAAARDAAEVQRDAPAPVRRNGVDGQFVPADHAFAEPEDAGDHFAFFHVIIVEDKAVRATGQKELHAPLLVAPGAGGDERPVAAVADDADLGGLAPHGETLPLRNAHRQMQRLPRIPRVAVVIAEEVVAVVRRQLLPLIFRVNLHTALSSIYIR